jgi:glycine dehydrogenase subunit 2
MTAETGPEPLIFERSRTGHRGTAPRALDLPDGEATRPLADLLPASLIRSTPPALPEVTENVVMRHYVRLSGLNHHIERGFYPLGSCTMKYNPKVNDEVAGLVGFAASHPLMPDEWTQGLLAALDELQNALASIAGLPAVSLVPAAGSQGELAGLLIARAYHRSRGEDRRTVLIPDSAHGTNPASVRMAGCAVRALPSNERGRVDLAALDRALDESVALLMLTNPNTLGLFETDIERIARHVHEAGGLMYMDGANLNALAGRVRPGDLGYDIMHTNLHKTFSTPHGGGGPGAGPIAVRADLAPFLPIPVLERRDGRYVMNENRPQSIGRLHSFAGNVGVLLRAWAYIASLGADGIREMSGQAVLNANYLMALLRDAYDLPFEGPCMHEFVLSGRRQKAKGVKTTDIAKRILDFGMYAPTIYFPLIVEEALMIEPTESEPKEAIDAFADVMHRIAREVEEEPDTVRGAPHRTPVARLDEARAARDLDVRWKPPAR